MWKYEILTANGLCINITIAYCINVIPSPAPLPSPSFPLLTPSLERTVTMWGNNYHTEQHHPYKRMSGTRACNCVPRCKIDLLVTNYTLQRGLQRIGNGEVSTAAALHSHIRKVFGLSIRISYILPVVFLIYSIRMPSQLPCITHLTVVDSFIIGFRIKNMVVEKLKKQFVSSQSNE